MRTEQRRAKVTSSDAAWEKAKAARRNLAHDDAVQESRALATQFREMWSNAAVSSAVDVNQILRTLGRKRIPFVLTGAHGIGGCTGRPRGTHDVDVLVKAGRNHARAVSAIKALYPTLEVRHFPGVTAFFLSGEKESVIDVTVPHRADLEETLATALWVENKVQGLRYRIPSLEAALANKYGAMLTPTRDSRKRRQDILDFEWMVTHSLDEGQQAIDREERAALGKRVWPEGGAEETVRLVDDVVAGKAIHLDSLE